MAVINLFGGGGWKPPVGTAHYLGSSWPTVTVDGMTFLKAGLAVSSSELPSYPISTVGGVQARVWSAVTSGFGSTIINAVATNGAGVWVAVGGNGRMTRSTDNGATWSAVTSGFGSTIINAVATDGAGVWVAVGGSGMMTRSPLYIGIEFTAPNLYLRIA
jgi:hypothetical protein